jgi:hypothetical protein
MPIIGLPVEGIRSDVIQARKKGGSVSATRRSHGSRPLDQIFWCGPTTPYSGSPALRKPSMEI